MEKDVFSYLDKDYRYLNNYIKKVNGSLFTSPQNAIINGRTFVESLTQEIAKLEGHGLLNMITQTERLSKLKDEETFDNNIEMLFNEVRILGNKAVRASAEEDLEAALKIHKNIYEITCWFVETYVDYKFETTPYKNFIPSVSEDSEASSKMTSSLMEKIKNYTAEDEEKNKSDDEEDKDSDEKEVSLDEKEESEDIFEDIIIESIINDRKLDEKCLVKELTRLKQSLKEDEDVIGEFSPFKRYMHVERDDQKKVEELIFKANDSANAQLILVCGSAGDEKAHIISYVNYNYPDIMKNYTLHNDITESLRPNKISMDTLNEVLDSFSDEKIKNNNKKLILAINIATLSNFIDSKYGERFLILKKYVQDKNILESSVEEFAFDDDSSVQFINLMDYPIFTLNNGKVNSEYIKSLINRITNSSENNIFYSSYKRNCSECSNCNCCPVKANYELLSNENIQDNIIDILARCIKNKIVISTRVLLKFMYELIVPISYIDVDSILLKKDILNLNELDYMRSLMPNIIFNNKELSKLAKALNKLDPIIDKNKKTGDFIIEFNNAKDVLPYFKEYIDYPKGYIKKLKKKDFKETEDESIRRELLKLFIRSYSVCGNGKEIKTT